MIASGLLNDREVSLKPRTEEVVHVGALYCPNSGRVRKSLVDDVAFTERCVLIREKNRAVEVFKLLPRIGKVVLLQLS